MWFKNLMVFEFDAEWNLDEEALEEKLDDRRLRACPNHAHFSKGWDIILKDIPEKRAFGSTDHYLLSLVKQSRVLPTSVVKKEVAERAESYEEENAKAAGAALKRQFKEEVEFELLPKAFVVEKKTSLYLDLHNKRVLIDTSSGTVASDAIAEIVKSIGTLNLAPLKVCESLDVLFANWVKDPNSLPAGLEFGKQCKLTSLKEGKSAYQCRDLEYHLDDVENLLDNGLNLTELELIWQDRMSFVLTHQFELKRIKYLDCVEDSIKEHSDLEDPALILEANFRLMYENHAALINFFKQTFANFEPAVAIQKVESSDSMVA